MLVQFEKNVNVKFIICIYAMTNLIVKLIVPFTFCDEGEYVVRIWHDVVIKIKHVQNKEGVEKTKGIEIVGSPKMIPDDPFGLYYISEVELKIPLSEGESPMDLAMNDNTVKFLCARYLSRLTEVIRFATHRYWIRLISQWDIDIFRIEEEDEKGRDSLMPIGLGFPSENIFAPLPILSQDSKKSLINKILSTGLKIQLSNNLLLDSLSNFHVGKFSEAIILVNISLEVFVEEFMTEKYISEGKNQIEANKSVDKLFHGNFHKTMSEAFFNHMTKDERNHHDIWIKFENVRKKRKEVTHPHTRKLSPEESYQVFLDVVFIREWILSLSFEKK